MNNTLDLYDLNNLRDFVDRYYFRPRASNYLPGFSLDAVNQEVKTIRLDLETFHLNQVIDRMPFEVTSDVDLLSRNIILTAKTALLKLPEQTTTESKTTQVPADWFSHFLLWTGISCLKKYAKLNVIVTSVVTKHQKLILPPVELDPHNYPRYVQFAEHSK